MNGVGREVDHVRIGPTRSTRSGLALAPAVLAPVLLGLLAAASGPAAAAPPTLLVAHRVTSERCEFRLVTVPDGSERPLFATTKCAWPGQGDVLWDIPLRRVLYAEEGRLWTRPLADPSSAPKELAPLPEGDAHEVWVDERSGLLRAAWLVPVDEEKDVTYRRVVVPARPGERGRVLYDPVKVRFEGKSYDAEAVGRLGSIQMALLAELRDGKWDRLESIPTNAGECEAPGTRELRTPRRPDPRVVSLRQLDAFAATLQGEPSNDPRLKPFFRRESARLCVDARTTLVTAADLSYPPSYSAPAFLLVDGVDAPRRLDVGGLREFGNVQARGGYVLITPPNGTASGERARVFDAKGELVLSLPPASWTSWFPAERLE